MSCSLVLQLSGYARIVCAVVALIVAVLATAALVLTVTRASIVTTSVLITTITALLHRHVRVAQEFGASTLLALRQLALGLLFGLVAAHVVERVHFPASTGSRHFVAFTQLRLVEFLLHKLVEVLKDSSRNLDLHALRLRCALDVAVLAALDAAYVAKLR